LRTKISVVVLLLLLGGLGYRFYRRGLGTLGAPPSPVATAYKTEEQWIAHAIASDLARMVAYAKDGRVASPVPAPGVPALPGGPWSIEDHTATARALLAANGLAPRDDAPSMDTALLAELTTPTAEVLERRSGRLSSALRIEFARPDRHEEAALLLGAFAMREADGHFTDVRPALGRMTAHLAFASALRTGGERSLAGRYAEAVHAALTGRAAEALTRLTALKASPDPQNPWLDALALRVTEDWRTFGDPGGRTLLERLEYVRALVATRNDGEVLAFLQRPGLEALADWPRLVAPGHLGVEVGNLTVLPGLGPLLAELASVRRAASLPALEGAALPPALSVPPGPCVGAAGPQVLDWGAWAGFYSRAIADHIAFSDAHLRRVLGDPGGADEYQAQMDREWSGLTLYPMASTHRTRKMEMNLDHIADAITVAIERPELINAENWGQLEYAAPYEPIRRGPPLSTAWFAPTIVRGTAFDARRRLEDLSNAPSDRAALEALAAIHPYDFTIAMRLVRARHGARPSVADIEQSLGLRAGFDGRATHALAEAAENASPAQKGALLARQCAQAAVHCLELGHHLADEGSEDEAAAAFEKAFADPTMDAVQLANQSRWLIRYHFRKANRERALALATAAAATGSARGLGYHGELMELMERYPEAEVSYQREAERYGDPSGLIAFYYRLARGHGRKEYEARLQRTVRAEFPRGLEPIAAPEALGTEAPRDGAYVMGHSRTLLEAGLRAGDVVVGLDGWRIHTAAQYATARRFSRDDGMTFTFWRGGGYQQAKATVKERWLGVAFVDHPVKGWVNGTPEEEG
jgi:tetratricopeptide (TPR) repeat protein